MTIEPCTQLGSTYLCHVLLFFMKLIPRRLRWTIEPCHEDAMSGRSLGGPFISLLTSTAGVTPEGASTSSGIFSECMDDLDIYSSAGSPTVPTYVGEMLTAYCTSACTHQDSRADGVSSLQTPILSSFAYIRSFYIAYSNPSQICWLRASREGMWKWSI